MCVSVFCDLSRAIELLMYLLEKMFLLIYFSKEFFTMPFNQKSQHFKTWGNKTKTVYMTTRGRIEIVGIYII